MTSPSRSTILQTISLQWFQIPWPVIESSSQLWSSYNHGPLARYLKLRVAQAPGMPGTFSRSQWVSNPCMHHCPIVSNVPLNNIDSAFLSMHYQFLNQTVCILLATRCFMLQRHTTWVNGSNRLGYWYLSHQVGASLRWINGFIDKVQSPIGSFMH